MKFPTFIQLVFTFSLLAGCAAKPPAVPDWVSGDSAQYNKSQYLIGRGQATTQEDAKDRARADLSKIFQVSVAAESEDVQKFKTGQTGQGEYATESSRRIMTRTSQIIRGIQIAELWQDPLTKTHHALAILPRLQTAASLRQQIGQLDEATSNYVEQSRKNTDLFLKISTASLAIESQQESESLQKSLQVVDPTGRGSESQWSSAKLGSDLDELLKRVRIAPRITTDSNPALTEIVAGALAKAGFMIETGQYPDFVLEAQLGRAAGMKNFLKVVFFSLLVISGFWGFSNYGIPQIKPADPPGEEKVDLGAMTMEQFVALGKKSFDGKGTCTL